MSSTTSSILPLPLLTVVYRESDYAFCNRSRRSSRRCDGCPGRSRSRVTAAGSSGARRPSLQPTSSRRVFGVMIPSPSTALCCLQRPSSVVHRLADWAACGPGGPRHSVMNRPGVFAPIPSVLLVVTPGGCSGSPASGLGQPGRTWRRSTAHRLSPRRLRPSLGLSCVLPWQTTPARSTLRPRPRIA